MTFLFEMFLAIVALALVICLIVVMFTMAFDMTIPEIVEWWERRKKNEAD